MPVYHTTAGTIETLEWGEGPGVRPEAWIIRLLLSLRAEQSNLHPVTHCNGDRAHAPGLPLGSLRS